MTKKVVWLAVLCACTCASFGAVYTDGLSEAAALTHRWSFTDFTDSVGSATAVASVDTIACADGAVTLPGTGYVDLGAGVIPTDSPFTLEFFATTHQVITYSRIFSIGQGTDLSNTDALKNEIFFMSWTFAGNAARDEIRIVSGTQADAQIDLLDKLQPYTVDTPWHIVVSATPQDDGTMKFLFVKEALDGSGRRTVEAATGAAWGIASPLNPTSFFLGHSRWAQDKDANATYDEVRIWNTAFTLEQAKLSALLGPDVLPTAEASGAVERTVTATAGELGQVQLGESTAASVTTTVAGDELVTLTAVPNAGCRLVKWTGSTGSIVTGDETSATIVVAAAKAPTLTATFEPVTLTWAGAGTEGSNWSEAANWVDPANPFPVFDQGSVIFTGNARTVNTNDYVSTLKGMTFDAAAGSFTVAGQQLDLLSLANFSAQPQRIELPISASAYIAVTNNGTLTFADTTLTAPSGIRLDSTAAGSTTLFTNTTFTAKWADLGDVGGKTVFKQSTVKVTDNFYNSAYLANGQRTDLEMTDSTVSSTTFCTDNANGSGATAAAAGGDAGVKQTRGTMSASNYFIVGRDRVGTYDLDHGTLNVTGNAGQDRFFIGEVAGSTGTLNVFDSGTVDCTPNLQVGRYGTGTLNISNGGTVNVASWFSIARQAVGVGTVNVGAGGTLNQSGSTYAILVGEQGQGALNIAGENAKVVSANGVRMTAASAATAKLTITDGGTLETPWIRRFATGTLTSLYVDGGTIRASGSDATLGNFLDIANLSVGPKGMTLDTGDHTVVSDHGLVQGGSSGTITKVGSGKLVVPLADAGSVKVAEGSLCAVAGNAVSGTTPRLRHRWSFNGDLTDSVGGKTATVSGSTSFVNNTLRLPGGTKGTGWADLGADLIPTDGPFTIELFATQVGIQNWSRIFSFGHGAGYDKEYFFMSWTRGTTIGNDRISSNAFSLDETLQPFTVGTKWHIAATFVPNFCGDGRMKMFWTKESLDGTIRRYYEYITSGSYNFASMNQDTFYLGHSRWPDYDAQADYDEVRIWDAALTPEQLAQNAQLGPDVLPTAVSSDGYLAESALLHRWSFNGSLADSVSGTAAATVGSTTLGTNEITLPGGNNGTGYVNLGTNQLPTDGSDVTIEIWARENAVKNWSRIFDIGNNTANYMTLAWSQGTSTTSDRFEIKKGGTTMLQVNNTLVGYVLGTRYHLSLTVKKQADGTSLVSWTRRAAGTGDIIKSASGTSSKDWTVADSAVLPFYLGHSQFSGDNDASASYDEVRVWKGVMSEAQLTESARRGPDVLPTASPTKGTAVEVAAGTTLQGLGQTQVEKLTGTGTLAGSLEATETLDIAGEAVGAMTLTGALKVSGTWIVDTNGSDCDTLDGADQGTLDLDGATLVLRNHGAFTTPYVLATVANATNCDKVTISGLKNYEVRYNPTTKQVTLKHNFVCIFVR